MHIYRMRMHIGRQRNVDLTYASDNADRSNAGMQRDALYDIREQEPRASEGDLQFSADTTMGSFSVRSICFWLHLDLYIYGFHGHEEAALKCYTHKFDRQLNIHLLE